MSQASISRELLDSLLDPDWQGQRDTRTFYGWTVHAGRKHSRELTNEEKARKGQPLK